MKPFPLAIITPVLALGALLLASLSLPSPSRAADQTTKETAVLGAGCFWCVEAVFEQQPGVLNVVSGFAGGHKPDPTYEEVCTETTGHAEVVEITFDPTKTSYAALLDLFWKTHDPTDGRGVAPDFGPSYRSIILPNSPTQRAAVEKSKAEAQKRFDKPIATEVSDLKKFYPASEYHQDFVKNHPDQSYVRNVSIPKLKKLGLKIP